MSGLAVIAASAASTAAMMSSPRLLLALDEAATCLN